MPSAPPIRTALIGYGFAGRTFHEPLIRAEPALELAAIATSRSADTPAAIFADPTIELVVIATPNDTHFQLASGALEAGKHVVVDKPMTTSAADAKRLAALATSQGRLLTVFQNRRWDSDFLTLRRLLNEGVFGEVMQLESHYDRFRPEVRGRWREQAGEGTGIWWDLGPHLVDQVLLLFGRPEAIFADFAGQREGAVVTDYFHVLLRYPRLRVILHGSSLARSETARFLVQGTAASYRKFGLDTQEKALKKGQAPGGNGWGADPRLGILTTDRVQEILNLPGNYPEFYRSLADAIRGHTVPPVTVDQAVRVMDVLESAVISDRERHEIFLPEN